MFIPRDPCCDWSEPLIFHGKFYVLCVPTLTGLVDIQRFMILMKPLIEMAISV